MSKTLYMHYVPLGLEETFQGSDLNEKIIVGGFDTGLLKYHQVLGNTPPPPGVIGDDYDYIEFTVSELTFTQPANPSELVTVDTERGPKTYLTWLTTTVPDDFVIPGGNSGGVDLTTTITDVRLNPDSVAVVHTITNSGSATAGAQNLGYYLSTDATTTTADTFLGQITIDALAGHSTVAWDVTSALPSGLAPGRYYVGVIADYDGKIDETNNDNNASQGWAITIGVEPTRHIDLGTLSAGSVINRSDGIAAGADEVIYDFRITSPLTLYNFRLTGGDVEGLLEADSGNRSPTLGIGPDRHLFADRGFGSDPQVVEDPLMPGLYHYTVSRNGIGSDAAPFTLISDPLAADEAGNNITWAKSISVVQSRGSNSSPTNGTVTTVDNKDVWKFSLTEKSSVLVSLALQGVPITQDGVPPIHYEIRRTDGSLVLESHTDAVSPFVDSSFTTHLIDPSNTTPPEPGDYYNSDPNNIPLDPGDYYISVYKSALTSSPENYSLWVNAWPEGAANRPTVFTPGAEGPDSAVIGNLTDKTYAHHDFVGLADRNDFFVFYVTKRSVVTFNLTNPSADVSINLNLGGLPYHKGEIPDDPLTLPTPDPVVSDIGPFSDIRADGGARKISALLDPGIYDLRVYTDTSFADPNGTAGYGDAIRYPKNGGAFYDLSIESHGAAGGLIGTSGPDNLFGTRNADLIDGKGGADVMAGLAGDDRYNVDNAGDKVIETAGEGSDRVSASVSYGLAAGQSIELLTTTNPSSGASTNLTGNEFAQTISGNAGKNVINGKGGVDNMYGGAGDDTYFVASAADRVFEAAGGGSDRVNAAASFALKAGQSVELLATVSSAAATALNLTGNELAQTISGNAGRNVLDGKGGADAMYGGAGDDTYFVDNARDGVFEAAGGGSDRVNASVSYALKSGQSIELFTTISAAGVAAISLTGNEFAQTINGNAGKNVIDGRGGADKMFGGSGDDTYFVDNTLDRVFETAGGGSDRVNASVSYTLGSGQSIELFATTNSAGTSAIKLTGNEFAQSIFGNSGSNAIDGKGGADQMFGGAGNDSYFVDNTADRVFETAGNGSDRVSASASYVLAASQSVELLTTVSATGNAPINLTGNDLAQTINGNAGANVIDGKGGADLMFGGKGGDSYVVDNSGDHVYESAHGGTDRVSSTVSFTLAAGQEIEVLTALRLADMAPIKLIGNAFANTVRGNAGANILNGGDGNDTLIGLGGNDHFRFSTALNAATNVDHISDFAVGEDKIDLDRAVFAAFTTPGALSADAFFAGTAAHDADDRIIYDPTTGALIYDSNGNLAGGDTVFAVLASGLALSQTDFLVI